MYGLLLLALVIGMAWGGLVVWGMSRFLDWLDTGTDDA